MSRPRKAATVMMRVPVEFKRLVDQMAKKNVRPAVEQLRVFMAEVEQKRLERLGYLSPPLAEYPRGDLDGKGEKTWPETPTSARGRFRRRR